MKLSKLCKRVLAVTLTAALAVGTPVALGSNTAKAYDEQTIDGAKELKADDWWDVEGGPDNGKIYNQ